MSPEKTAQLEVERRALLDKGNWLQDTIQCLMRERDACFEKARQLYRATNPSDVPFIDYLEAIGEISTETAAKLREQEPSITPP